MAKFVEHLQQADVEEFVNNIVTLDMPNKDLTLKVLMMPQLDGAKMRQHVVGIIDSSFADVRKQALEINIDDYNFQIIPQGKIKVLSEEKCKVYFLAMMIKKYGDIYLSYYTQHVQQTLQNNIKALTWNKNLLISLGALDEKDFASLIAKMEANVQAKTEDIIQRAKSIVDSKTTRF